MNLKDISNKELEYRLQTISGKSEIVRKKTNDLLSELEKYYEEIIELKNELALRNNEQQ